MLALRQCVELSSLSLLHGGGFEQSFRLRPDLARFWAPGLDTTSLHLQLKHGTAQAEADLEREIVSAMLLSPLVFDFPSHAELAAAVRMRCNIVVAARKQPEVSGQLYSFSCYRATEYVILLALAQELERSNPDLLARLQQQWE